MRTKVIVVITQINGSRLITDVSSKGVEKLVLHIGQNGGSHFPRFLIVSISNFDVISLRHTILTSLCTRRERMDDHIEDANGYAKIEIWCINNYETCHINDFQDPSIINSWMVFGLF